MIELEAPVLPARRYVLAADPERVERTAETGPVLASRIALSPPAVIPLGEALIGDDAELRAFWQAASGAHAFDFLSWVLTFEPAAGEQFERAWLTVQFETGDASAPAIAWSMQPASLAHNVKLSRTAKLGAGLQLLGLEASLGEEQVRERAEHVVRAFRLRSAAPYWAFRRTPSAALEGDFALRMIVRRPLDRGVDGRFDVRLTINRRRFLLFERRDQLDQPAALGFRLGDG
ncbi:MAG: hypothetical protein EA356_17870 [Geminicoccaceae bacterium]|nr:MAG: hypothetical protein EA356_17870 [Geminicoccaceae bacterium]